jgi:hypothetical protein
MYKTIVCAAALAALFFSGAVDAAGITGFTKPTLTIYSDEDGSREVGNVKRGKIKFPARILTFLSDAGLIKAAFEYAKGDKPPVSGWSCIDHSVSMKD